MDVRVRTAGVKLRTWRRRRGLTLAAAGLLVDQSASVWCTWERARRRPALEHALAIELATRGHVRVEDWSFPRALVARVLKFAAMRSRRRTRVPSVAQTTRPTHTTSVIVGATA